MILFYQTKKTLNGLAIKRFMYVKELGNSNEISLIKVSSDYRT